MNTPAVHTPANFENTGSVEQFEEQVDARVRADKSAEDMLPVAVIEPHHFFVLYQAVEPDHY